MNEELDSQLSAMFDNELPAAECELLARRLSRDGDLKARWGRYAVIGAVIRAERGVTPRWHGGRARKCGPDNRARADGPDGRIARPSAIPLVAAACGCRARGRCRGGLHFLAAVAGSSRSLSRDGSHRRRQLEPGGACRAAGPAERERPAERQLCRAAGAARANDGRPRHGAGRLRGGPQRLLLACQPRRISCRR